VHSCRVSIVSIVEAKTVARLMSHGMQRRANLKHCSYIAVVYSVAVEAQTSAPSALKDQRDQDRLKMQQFCHGGASCARSKPTVSSRVDVSPQLCRSQRSTIACVGCLPAHQASTQASARRLVAPGAARSSSVRQEYLARVVASAAATEAATRPSKVRLLYAWTDWT
jgi:hypothetical protein